MTKQSKFYRSVIWVAVVTVLLLMVPLVAMQFTSEVNWSGSDFIIMGALIFGTGFSYVLLTRTAPNIVYRIAMAAALGTTFFMVWANLAVGLIGAGPNPGNLMYMAVVFVVIFGTILSRFRAAGMERAMYATTLALVLHTVVALSANMQDYPSSSVVEILAVNGFFAGLFLLTGSLFRYAANENVPKRA